MRDEAWLAKRFEEKRAHLKGVAQRILGSATEAEDAVQEAWLRLSRSDAEAIENLGGWLTTVTARICLDMLRARKGHREELLEEGSADAAQGAGPAGSPAGPEAAAPGPAAADEELILADSMGPALMLVLDHLAPAERVAFVLHDVFAVSFDEIAGILGRTPEAARQLASRGRRRIQGRDAEGSSSAPATPAAGPAADRGRSRRVVDAFLSASRDGDFHALLAALHPDVVLRADALAVQTAAARKQSGAPDLAPEIRGAKAVAETFKGRASGALRALIDGAPGAAWVFGGAVRSVFVFTVAEDRIAGIELVMDPARLQAMQVELLP